MTTNTAEDKIYRRQVSKTAMFLAALTPQDMDITKYFTHHDLTDILSFNKDDDCETIIKLRAKNAFEIPDIPSLKMHYNFLKNLDGVKDITNHGNLFSDAYN